MISIRVGRHAAGPLRSSREWRKIRSSQSTGTARTHYDLRMASLRWTSQKHTNVATVSPFAAPSGTARPQSDLGVASLRWASGSPRNWRQLRIPQPQDAQDGPKTSPVRPQEAPKRAPRQPKRPSNWPKELQDSPGGPQDGSKTAQNVPKIAHPASFQEAPRRPTDGWRWPGSSSIMHPRSQSHRT